MTHVKICGLRTIEAVRTAVEAGATFIGFNFVPSSRRYIELSAAQEIMQQIGRTVKYVGVFQNDPVETVNFIADTLQLDYVQLHGKEGPEYTVQVNRPVINAFALEQDFDAEELAGQMREYQNVPYFLLDRKEQGQGEPLNLNTVRELTNEFEFFLAGGLNPENVKNSVLIANPFGVDVASGIETKGKTDLEKITQFVRNAQI